MKVNKFIIAGILLLFLIAMWFVCINHISAITIEEINTKITECETKIIEIESMQQTTHNLANTKRDFGFLNEDIIIQNLKQNWNLLEDEKSKLLTQLEELKVEKAEIEKQPQKKYIGNFKIYGYCKCVKCTGSGRGVTASGAMAQEGITIAVDPNTIPLNSNVYIDGVGHRKAQDTGGNIKSNTIDLYFNNHQSALNWGVQYRDVWIYE